MRTFNKVIGGVLALIGAGGDAFTIITWISKDWEGISTPDINTITVGLELLLIFASLLLFAGVWIYKIHK